MQFFFKTVEEIGMFRSTLPFCQCPACGMTGAMIRHGYTYWSISPTENGIRGWRIRCKPSNHHEGCGATWLLRLGDTLPRRCFSAKQLWAFIQTLLDARSLKQAWERSGLACSLDTAYKIYRRLQRCQTVLRTHLCARGPPPRGKTGVPLFQVYAHLEKEFGNLSPITAYQISFQKDFLAVA